jgi:hypothetical protein
LYAPNFEFRGGGRFLAGGALPPLGRIEPNFKLYPFDDDGLRFSGKECCGKFF